MIGAQKIHDVDSKFEVHSVCAGKNCTRSGKTLLNIRCIKKKGIFCDTCSSELLQLGLAELVRDKDQ